MKKKIVFILFLLSIPILFPLYNPSLELGFMGVILGFWGLFISPIIILGTFLYLLFKK